MTVRGASGDRSFAAWGKAKTKANARKKGAIQSMGLP
jgi:hypothetical protein